MQNKNKHMFLHRKLYFPVFILGNLGGNGWSSAGGVACPWRKMAKISLFYR